MNKMVSRVLWVIAGALLIVAELAFLTSKLYNLYRVPPRCAGMLATVLSGP